MESSLPWRPVTNTRTFNVMFSWFEARHVCAVADLSKNGWRRLAHDCVRHGRTYHDESAMSECRRTDCHATRNAPRQYIPARYTVYDRLLTPQPAPTCVAPWCGRRRSSVSAFLSSHCGCALVPLSESCFVAHNCRINVKKTTVYTHVNGDRRSQFAHQKQQK